MSDREREAMERLQKKEREDPGFMKKFEEDCKALQKMGMDPPAHPGIPPSAMT